MFLLCGALISMVLPNLSLWKVLIIVLPFSIVYCAPEDHTERLLNLDLGAKCELFCPPPEAEYASWEMHFKVTYDVEGEGRKEKTIETEEFLREGMGLGLNVRVSDSELKSGLLKYMFSKYERSDVKPV